MVAWFWQVYGERAIDRSDYVWSEVPDRGEVESVVVVLGVSDHLLDHFRVCALRTSSQPVTVAKLAKDAGISRSWLYTQSDLIAAVRQLDGQARAPRSTPATERSLQVRLAAALARNQRILQRLDTLTEQNKQQRQQLERAYAEIRRLQVSTSSSSPAPTVSPDTSCQGGS